MEDLEMSLDELVAHYCETQQGTPQGLHDVLAKQAKKYDPDGWFIVECVVMDSSRLGSRVIMPFGPNNTYKSPPPYGAPISPRGLASDMSVIVGVHHRNKAE